jgi:hypothetical protein
MAMDFNDPSTVNALAMALGFVGQAFAQNPQQAQMAQQAVGLAQGQQRSNLLANLLKTAAPGTQVGANPGSTAPTGGVPTTKLAGVGAPFQEGGAMAAPAGMNPTNTGASPSGLNPQQTQVLAALLGGGQAPFGLTQRR